MTDLRKVTLANGFTYSAHEHPKQLTAHFSGGRTRPMFLSEVTDQITTKADLVKLASLCPNMEATPILSAHQRQLMLRVAQWQDYGLIHPLTCLNDSTHNTVLPIPWRDSVVLVCPDCGTVQHEVPPFITGGTP